MPTSTDADKKRYPPAPGDEGIAGHRTEHEHCKVREEQPRWHTELRPGCDESSMFAGARPFHRKQHRTAPLAADTDALDEAQHGQQDRAPDPDGFVGRHQAHQEGGNAHQHQCGDQRRLASEAITPVAEDGRADWPGDETDRIDREGLQRSNQRIGAWKVQLRKDKAGDCAVEEEVIPLDRGAHRGGHHRAAELSLMFPVSESRCLPGRFCRAARHGVASRGLPCRVLATQGCLLHRCQARALDPTVVPYGCSPRMPSTAVPYRCSLDAPTPLICASSSMPAGCTAAMSRSAVS